MSILTKTGLKCRNCGHEPGLWEFLSRDQGIRPSTSTARYTCPQCGASGEFRVAAGKLQFGYTYAAGEIHLATTQEVTGIPRIHARVTTEGLRLEAGGKAYLIASA